MDETVKRYEIDNRWLWFHGVKEIEYRWKNRETKVPQLSYRGWMYPKFGNEERSTCIRYQLVLGSKFCHLYFVVSPSSDDDLKFAIAFPGVALWLGLENRKLSKFLYESFKKWYPKDYYESREIYVGFHHGSLWWNFWTPRDSWSSTTPKYRNGSFDFADFLLGDTKYSKKQISGPERVRIELPEGEYWANVTLYECTWKRPRWRANIVHRAEIEVEGNGIPTPGKGENSWDQDDRHTSSMTTPARTVTEAIASLKASIERDREKYGGKNWVPNN